MALELDWIFDFLSPLRKRDLLDIKRYYDTLSQMI